jgi:hypothetical protein
MIWLALFIGVPLLALGTAVVSSAAAVTVLVFGYRPRRWIGGTGSVRCQDAL